MLCIECINTRLCFMYFISTTQANSSIYFKNRIYFVFDVISISCVEVVLHFHCVAKIKLILKSLSSSFMSNNFEMSFPFFLFLFIYILLFSWLVNSFRLKFWCSSPSLAANKILFVYYMNTNLYIYVCNCIQM